MLCTCLLQISVNTLCKGDRRPGIHALDIATGEVLWSHSEENLVHKILLSVLQDSPRQFHYLPASCRGLNGIFHAYSSSTGAKLWKFDTRREYRSVNQLTGKGGTIDGSGP